MLAANRRLAEELRLHVTVSSDSLGSSGVLAPAADTSCACALIMELLLEASSDWAKLCVLTSGVHCAGV